MSRKELNIEGRKKFIASFIIIVVFIYLLQLFNLQILNKDYKTSADSNAFLRNTLYPSRGIMYDRNGKLLVYTQPAYDVTVVMKETQDFDTLSFCRILDISYEQCIKLFANIKNRNLNPGYSPYVPQSFLSQINPKEYGLLRETLYKYPGFYIQHRTVRQYDYPNAAHLLGYVAEADKKNIEADSYYTQGDYIGKSGVECSYEKYLRGEKGVEILLRDAHGRIKGKYENGVHDKAPVSGKNLTLSIDINLQAYGEELMRNKTGSIIMIEPETGEILCMVTSPSYDPSILVGRQLRKNYWDLQNDPAKPLLNRSISGRYPPGSTFKPAQGLIFLEEGIISSATAFPCAGGFPPGPGGRPKCHPHGSPLPLIPAVATSCNSYFCYGMRDMLHNRKKYGSISQALEVWKNRIVAQGYGYTLRVDIPGESRGFIPNSKFYDNTYRKGGWNALTIISNAIGQGEITATPLQICNLAATIANRGYYYPPHAVKSIEETSLDTLYTTRKYTGIHRGHYESMVEGMAAAVTGGTCRETRIPDIEVCGKTGTAQNPHGKDHSIFIGFAPRDNPKVAIVVLVENGGFGATYGVPIGKLMMEKCLKGEVPASDLALEQRMKDAVVIPYLLQNALPKN